MAGPRLLAWAAVVLTVVLITVGGLVTNTDSGLACPDWPTCFGTPFPTLVGGVLMEHGHRYIATALGFLTVLLVVATGHRRPRSMLPILLVASPLILGGATWAGIAKHQTGSSPLLALVLVAAGYLVALISIYRSSGAARHAESALLLVITQGLLGGLTVIYQLPVTVLILHLGTSMLFLGVLVWLAVRLGDSPQQLDDIPSSTYKIWLPMATSFLYIQILIGASVRHTGAGLVCTDFLCHGAIWPTHVHPAVHLHMLHRAFAILAGGFACWVAYKLRGEALASNDKSGARVAAAIPILLLIQIALGIATIWTLKEIWAVTAHLFVAALLLASCAFLWARSARSPAKPEAA